ncbi:putative high mobility group B protein 11 [Brassica napus]|uniref:putative high mobility group B protein 11 n=1 Tax=Brassica napus TaxID=3708 RepID=UPI0020790EAB|nr:putative high mobility group B protein 11 [Brassica napus]
MSTNDNSTYLQFQLVPTYGSSSDNKSDADSSGTTTYLDLIANSDLFRDKLHDLPQDSGRIVKDPNVGGEILDLHQLFIEMIRDCKCNEVIGTFNLKTEVKNAAYVLRKTYLKMLFELEHMYFFKEPISHEGLNTEMSESVYPIDAATAAAHGDEAGTESEAKESL